MALFNPAVERLLKMEGGFAACDNGAGAVKYGITSRLLRLIGEPSGTEDVRALTPERAIEIYRRHFWDELFIGHFRHQEIAEQVFFAAVNMGPHRPTKYLQECLCETGREVAVDGVVGLETLGALNALSSSEVPRFLECFKSKLLARYEELAERNPAKYGDDLEGWKKRLGV